MGIELGNPALAWGALAALVPILVHLIQRRRPRPHPFAAIELVRRSQKRNVRRLRLKRLLLLAARTTILLAIPLALARPRLATPEAKAAAAPRGAAATALVIDASLSMGYDAGGPLLDRARADARDALAGLSAEEPVTVVPCDGRTPAPPAPDFDRGAARRAIDELEGTLLPADLSACVAAAARALGESAVPGKRIWVFTDLAASGWRLDAPAPTVPTAQGDVRPEVTIVDAARGEPLPNAAVVELDVKPAPEVGPRAEAFAFTVRNFSGEPIADRTVELVVGEQVVAKTFVDVPAGGAATKQLAHKFPKGGSYAGKLRLVRDDLAADDERPFLVRVPRDVRALVVDGAPNPVRFRDEAFFVDAALRMGGASPIHVTTVDAESFADQDLSGYDLVFLLNVRAGTGAEAEPLRRLEGFVRAGGGLFVSLGDAVDADAYAAALGPVLPRALHLPKAAGERGKDDAPPARISTIDVDHPVLHVFAGEAREGLVSTRTYRYFLLQPGRDGDGSRVLASYDDGAPALVEGALGKGRVLLYTSTVDRDWSDWPIQPSFLPALQQAAAYLARSLEEARTSSGVVGAPFVLDLPEGAVVDEVLGPDGKPRGVASKADEPPRVEATREPGVYTVRGRLAGEEATRELSELSFALHVDPRESDTRRIDPRELEALFGGEKVEVAKEASSERKKDTPLWSVLLLVGVLAFFGEGLLLRK